MKFITEEISEDKHLLSSYAAGKVFTSAIFDSLICQVKNNGVLTSSQAYFNPYIIDIVKLLVMYEVPEHENSLVFSQSTLQQIDLPQQFAVRVHNYLRDSQLCRKSTLLNCLMISCLNIKCCPLVFCGPVRHSSRSLIMCTQTLLRTQFFMYWTKCLCCPQKL